MTLLLHLLVLLAIIAIGWYVINYLGLPPPIKMVAVVIIAILAILFLLQLAGGGIGSTSLLR